MTGKRTKEVAAKLGNADDLPGVAAVRETIAATIAPRLETLIAEADKKRRLDLLPFDALRLELTKRHARERERLDAGLARRQDAERQSRAQRFRTGVSGLWDRLNGRHAAIRKQNDGEALEALKRDRAQRDAMVEGQLVERRSIQKHIKAVQHRHTAAVAELHRDLSRQKTARQSQRPERDGLSDGFREAAGGNLVSRECWFLRLCLWQASGRRRRSNGGLGQSHRDQ